jgi:hypothetical protein
MGNVVKEGYSLTQAYKFYKNLHFSKGESYKVSMMLYKDICRDFNQMVVEKVLQGKGVRLPHSMGMLWIKKFKINWDKPPVDLNATKQAGKVIYHLNEHSDGYCGRWQWTKRNQAISNLIYYSFKPTWHNKKKIPKIFKEGGHKKFFTFQQY